MMNLSKKQKEERIKEVENMITLYIKRKDTLRTWRWIRELIKLSNLKDDK